MTNGAGVSGWKLFVDDERDPAFLRTLRAQGERVDADGPWTVARTQQEAQALILKFGLPSVISFDHDYGPPDAGDGHGLAKWLVEQDLSGTVDLSRLAYQVHSRNPVGAANIRGVLDGYLRFKTRA